MGGVSEDDHLGFYNKTTLPWTETLEDNWKTIAGEIFGLVQQQENRLKPYFNESLTGQKKSWKIFTFFVWGWKLKKNMKTCPKTTEILKRIPHVVSASVSILEPGTEINPHRGDTNAVMRSHLALQVPGSLPECGLKVKYDERSWKEGKVLVFNDAARHTAWNLTKERRCVLILDVMRPEYAGKKFQVCSLVLAGLVMQKILQTFRFWNRFPKMIKNLLLYCIAGPINLILWARSF